MSFCKVTPDIIDEVKTIIGNEHVLTDKEAIEKYAHDETEKLVFYPEAVLKPNTPQQIAELFKLCNKKLIPVTPRAGGTGLSGGALPVSGGFLLSMERFNKIIDIDTNNLQATVESGVITEVFQKSVINEGLYLPLDIASKGSSLLGGNIAGAAGGHKAVKYGVIKDYILNLEVVLPTGEIIRTGANVLKNATGYNLTQLMIGSEGTLGVITKIVFKLIPYPAKTMLMLVPFCSAEQSCEAVSLIFKGGVTPSMLEFMEKDAMICVLKHLKDIQFTIKDNINAYLFIEIDGHDEKLMFKECEKINKILNKYDCDEILFADTCQHKEKFMLLRNSMSEAIKANHIYKKEDTVVPRAELPKLLNGIKNTSEKYGLKSICYGHAGDGNLHVNIVKGNISYERWNEIYPKCVREIFELCVNLGGTISGEHGVGYVQKHYLDIALDKKTIELQRGIKKLFDPNGILNPEKIFN